MTRMKFHQHKYAISISVILIALVSSFMAVQITSAPEGEQAILTMMFSFQVLTLAFLFILTSIVLHLREHIHDILDEVKKTKQTAKRKK